MELCEIILHICVQGQTYEQFYDLLAEELCLSKEDYPGESVRAGSAGKTPENGRKAEAVIR